MTTATTIENAIARSISHNEVVAVEFSGDEHDLKVWIEENTAAGKDFDISYENDGTLDVYSLDCGDGCDWRLSVTLAD